MGRRPPPRRPAGPIPHPERLAHGRSRGRLDRARFPRHATGARGGATGLAAALRVGTRWIGPSKFDYLVEGGSGEVVRRLKPDLAAIERVDGRGISLASRDRAPGSR